jgi:tetratricopeptide (TPR) repeat protein
MFSGRMQKSDGGAQAASRQTCNRPGGDLSYYSHLTHVLPGAHATTRDATAAPATERRAAICGTAAALAALVYCNALNNPFVYDDYRTVVENTSIVRLSNPHAIVMHDVTRPVVNLTYAIDRAAWGTAPFGFHLTNVLLHVVNVILLFQLAWRLATDWSRRHAAAIPVVAGVASLLFAVHPLMTEAVGYVSGRSEVLCGTFVLGAMLSGRRWLLEGHFTWAATTVVLWLFALATKELGAVLPFVLLAYDRLVLDGTVEEKRRRALSVHVPLISVALVAGFARLFVFARWEQSSALAIHLPYVWLAAEVIRRYIWLMFSSAGQAAFHEVRMPSGWLDPQVPLTLVALAIVFAIMWRSRRTQAGVTFGLWWFLLFLAPSSALIVMDRGEPMAEHRVYLAAAGAFLAAGCAAGWLMPWWRRSTRQRRHLAAAVLAIGLLSLAGQTILRNVVWSDPVMLWRESVEQAPRHHRPRLLLGEALHDEGRFFEAVDEFRTAIQLRPTEAAGYVKLGLSLAEMGHLDEAAAAFRELDRIEPRSPLALTGLGTVAMLSQQPEQARKYFQDALNVEPHSVPARQSLALLNEMQGRPPGEALRLCEEIQQLAPWTPGNDECIRRNRSRLAAGSTQP